MKSSSIIKGKNEKAIFDYLHQKALDTGSPSYTFGRTSRLAREIWGEPSLSQTSSMATIIASMENKGLLKRISYGSNQPIIGTQLLMKYTSNSDLVPWISTDTSSDAPEQKVLPFTGDRQRANNGTKLNNAKQNAVTFRMLFSKFKEEMPEAKFQEVLQAASQEFHTKMESDNFRYIRARTVPYSDMTLKEFVHGRINKEQIMEDLWPIAEIQRAQPNHPAPLAAEVDLTPVMEAIKNLKLPDLSSLSTKKDIDKVASEVKDMKETIERLKIAMYQGSNGSVKTAMARWFPGLPKQSNETPSPVS